MRCVLIGLVGLALTLPGVSVASRYTVNCNGGADFTDPALAAAFCAYWPGIVDTILIWPCVYQVTPTGTSPLPPYDPLWPIQLGPQSPAFVSTGGAAVTVFEGQREIPAFFVRDAAGSAEIQIQGFTFRELTAPIGKDSPYAGGHLVFVDNIVEDCNTGLHATSVSASSVVARNIIRRNDGPGIQIFHNSGLIEDNEICFNTDGIHGTCCEEPTITNNHIHDNSGHGVYCGFGPIVLGNLIEGNATGILVASHGTFEHNVIRANEIGIHHVGWGGSVHYNDICSNAGYNLRLSEYNTGDIDVTMNWWGSTDPDVIALGILDCHDYVSGGRCAIFEPFCEWPGCEPSPVQAVSWGTLKALFRRDDGRGPN